MKKYTVFWKGIGQVHEHGTYDTHEEAMQSIWDWWDKNNYTPNYVRTWNKGNVTHVDYGSHSLFYEIHELQK